MPHGNAACQRLCPARRAAMPLHSNTLPTHQLQVRATSLQELVVPLELGVTY